MLSVASEVRRLLQDMLLAAGENVHLELETTEIIPLAMAHALTFEQSIPENINLCAQVSILKALAGVPVMASAKYGYLPQHG